MVAGPRVGFPSLRVLVMWFCVVIAPGRESWRHEAHVPGPNSTGIHRGASASETLWGGQGRIAQRSLEFVAMQAQLPAEQSHLIQVLNSNHRSSQLHPQPACREQCFLKQPSDPVEVTLMEPIGLCQPWKSFWKHCLQHFELPKTPETVGRATKPGQRKELWQLLGLHSRSLLPQPRPQLPLTTPYLLPTLANPAESSVLVLPVLQME